MEHQYIQETLAACEIDHCDITRNLIHPIYQLLKDGIIDDTIEDSVYYLYCALYFRFIKIDEDETIKYYKQSIALGNIRAMYELGCLYHIGDDIENPKNNSKCVEYYQMEILNGGTCSYSNLGHYYYNIENDIEKSKEYFQLGIDHGCVSCVLNMSSLYYMIGNNLKALEYHMQGSELGDMESIRRLIAMCDELDEFKPVEDLIFKLTNSSTGYVLK